MEKRISKRVLKRLFVKFGTDSVDKIGFTGDLSTTGIFIKTNNVFEPGTHLNIHLTLPNNQVLHITGKVMWAKRVPPSLLRHTRRSGMGVQLEKIPPEYEQYLKTLK